MAPSAPSPASTHPSSATTSTGRSRTRSHVAFVQGHRAGALRLTRASSVPLRHLGQPHHAVAELVDARAVPGRRAADVAGVDALEDAGQLPVAEGDVEVEALEVASRRRRVARPHLGPAGESRHRRGGDPEQGRLVAGIGPVHHQQPDVGERVAEGADLPVEHGPHRAVGAEDGVVEPVVAVDDGRPDLRRDRRRPAGRARRRRWWRCRALRPGELRNCSYQRRSWRSM